MKNFRATVAVAVAVVLVAAGAGGLPARAQAPAPDAGGGGGIAAGTKAGTVKATSAPSTYRSVTVKGGYVASGVGLRNRGKGTIVISGIPKGATIESAYLYWSILGGAKPGSNFKQGRIRGHAVTGTLIGSGASPCWGTVSKGYAYRASVKSRVKGNGSYQLTRFASGITDGRDPFTTAPKAPLAEGASLVVIYKKSSYPWTRVVIANGYDMISSSPGTTIRMPFGFAATTPVGEVRTSFIGGDGQSNFSEPASRFNGVPVAGVNWDGNDRPVPRYSSGNLWDTQTVRAVDLVRYGDRSATMTVAGGSDCLVWVAQVLSIGRYGAADTDGDKLLDGWEANGYDSNGDGYADVALPGASVVRKDLYVEMDYMGAEATCPCHLPLAADLDRIVKVFNTAPQANNPNGQTGIALHLDAGSARGARFNLGGGNLVPFDEDLNPVAAQFSAIKAANFNPARAKIYYYMVWAHAYDDDTSSGQAFNVPNDSFVVTLGRWGGGGSSDEKVGTFIHEFGHDLGQRHGGTDDTNNKPNYLSVMNYSFQTSGVLHTGSTAPYFGYSSFAPPSLNEARLDERRGLRTSAARTYRTRWYCPNGSFVTSPGRADRNLDWTCSGRISPRVSADINGDGVRSTLTSYNNWGHLVYGGGAVGGGAVSPLTSQSVADSPRELTYKEAKLLR